MATTEVSLFDTLNASKDAFKAPAHIAQFQEQEGNIEERGQIPALGYEGKVWQIALNGEKTKLMRRNQDGDMEPVGVFRVVVLDYAKRRGRNYYEGTYDPNKVAAPLCWSDDGITPDASVPTVSRQHSKCEGCPKSVKGSKVSDNGKESAACAQHRMLAVVPANKLDFEPLRLKIAITSDWDKQSPELAAEGWFGFQNYLDFLMKKGVTHTAGLVTKMRFDAGQAYPKIMFSPDRWLEPSELVTVTPITKSEKVANLLAGTFTSNGVDAVVKDDPVDTSEEAKNGAEAALVAAVLAKKAADDKAAAEKAAKAQEKAAEKAAAKAAKEAEAKKLEGVKFIEQPKDMGEDDTITLPGVNAPAAPEVSPAAAKKAALLAQLAAAEKEEAEAEAAAKAKDVTPPKTAATSEVPADVAALLSDWGAD